MALTGKNISFPIYHDVDGEMQPFHNLVLRKAVVDSVVMSLGDKITGDVYYIDSDLQCTMQEYVIFNDVKYTLVNPPTLVKEGMVADNSDLKGMSKYSFEFYHPMYILGNLPFTDVAVSYDEMRYKSQDKTFSWIGRPADLVAKLNKNLEGTEWVVVLSDTLPSDTLLQLSEVLSFDNDTIADVLKIGYETWGLPFVVDKLNSGEYYHTDANNHNVDYYEQGKRFVVVFGLPSNEILDRHNQPFVFRYGQGVGLKNNSRTPRNNKIVTRIAGYGSENNIPYGYPQVRWYGNQDWDYTINNESGMQTITVNGRTLTAMSYPIYKGIVGGEYVKLIKHPFTRTHLMPSIYANDVFNKVSQYNADGTANTNYNPNIEIKDYYDAVANESGYDYVNLINTAAPSYEIHGFDDIKPELGVAQILGATPINADLTDADGWDDTMDDDGNYMQSYFKITLPQLTFDIYACAAITEEMQINMRSGACIGCTFTVQVDWEDYKSNFYNSDGEFDPIPHTTENDGHVRDITKYPDSSQGIVTVIVQKDINTFGTIMPNIYQYPQDGDTFVVLGISLPLEYITSAQERLDAAMKSYMLENNVYYFDYPLKFDEFFLANNVNILNQIRPNTMIRFEFNGDELELYVKQLTIKFNESPLPQYDITLTDNIEVVLNQIGKVAEDVYHLGTVISMLRQQFGKNVYVELAKKLSKVENDTANGLITFLRGLDVGVYEPLGFLGTGAHIGADGKGEFEEITIRGALRAAELVFNKISAEEGESIRSIGHGEILTVDEENCVATLKLEGDEWATIESGDICRGLYNTVGKEYDNASVSGEDENGFRFKAGFFASYFKVESIISSSKGYCEFQYSLQMDENFEIITEHPCPLMKFAVYGNTNNNKRERQSSIYITAVGIAPRLMFLAGVNTWRIKPENIKLALGNINNIKVWEEVTQDEYNDYSGTVGVNKKTWTTTVDGEQVTHYAVLKPLVGDAGFYCEDNIYLGGIIEQIKAAAMDAISSSVSNLGQSYVWTNNNSFIVDCGASGNVLQDTTIQIDAKLYFGSEICRLTSAKFNNTNGTLSENDTIASYSTTIRRGTQNFTSQTISVSLVGVYNNVEYTATKTITIFANKQGNSGTSGSSSAWIDTIPSAISIDCKPDGKIQSSHTETVTASLYVGNTLADSLTTNTLTYDAGNGSYLPIITPSSVSHGVATWAVRFANTNTPLTASALNVTLSNGTYTVNKTIMVLPVRQGTQGESTSGYSAQLTKSSDSITVDNDGNIVGGISNRLYTSVNIWDAQNGESLTYKESNISNGEYTLSINATNCSYSIANDGTISITAITDTSLNWCSLEIIAQTYDGVVLNFVYSVNIVHIDTSYLTFELTNEYDTITYRTQKKQYDGLPVETTIKAYANDIEYTQSGVTYGNVEIVNNPEIGYIKKVIVTSDLFDGIESVEPQMITNQSGAIISIDTRNIQIPITNIWGERVGLLLRVYSHGLVRLSRTSGTHTDIDLEDAKHWINVSCEVVYGGVTYVSPTKRFTISEITDTTIYRLLLSATAVSKDESVYTPNTINVQASITNDYGTKVYSMGEDDVLVDENDNVFENSNIKIRYIDGVYNSSGTNTLLVDCPLSLSSTPSGAVFTVVLVDLTNSNSPIYLDIQTVTINEGGKDGVGQSWVNANIDQIVIDCDADGKILLQQQQRIQTITASLRWGDDNCVLVLRDQSISPTFPTGTGTIDEGSLQSNSPSGQPITSVKKTFTFYRGNILNSGYITINLVGDINGVTHNATKTVSVIANKRGITGEGEEGRGIVSVNTYYKRSTDYSGVVPPSISIEDPTTVDGWSSERIMPTEEEPYLWRFTRTIYSKEPLVEQTDAEMIYVWQDLVNPNLLADTDFKSNATLSSWYSHGLVSNAASEVEEASSFGISTKYTSSQGYNQFYGLFKAEENGGQNSGYGVINFLAQYLYKEEDGLSKIEPNKWYTLSFYIYGKKGNDGQQDTNSFLFECNLVNIADTQNNNIYHGIEGGQVLTSTSPYINVRLGENQGFVRYVITFKTKQTFSGNIDVRWYMYVREYTQEIWLCKPKLEVGKVATDYKPMRTITEPIARTSTWEEGKQYYQGAMGEPYFDIVSRNNKWFKCLRTNVSNATNAPQDGQSTDFWEAANNLSFIATDLLLADEAVIRLMFSQKILMTNASNQLIASINEDGNGSYYIYYPKTGRKCMGFCHDGYIRYWNNDEGHTQRWRLGQGGEIEMEDRWDSIWLKSLGNSYEDDWNFNANTRYKLDEYHQFISKADGQNISQNMEIHEEENLASDLIPDGYYTPNERPTKTSGTLYQIDVYEIANGIIVDTGILYNNGYYKVND